MLFFVANSAHSSVEKFELVVVTNFVAAETFQSVPLVAQCSIKAKRHDMSFFKHDAQSQACQIGSLDFEVNSESRKRESVWTLGIHFSVHVLRTCAPYMKTITFALTFSFIKHQICQGGRAAKSRQNLFIFSHVSFRIIIKLKLLLYSIQMQVNHCGTLTIGRS